MKSPDIENLTITAREVTETERLHFLPRHFGRHMITVEAAVFAFMRQLAPDYRGGYWSYYELSNDGAYLAPSGSDRLRIVIDGNDFTGSLSADAAGITVCLFALSHLSFSLQQGRMTEHFHHLREFALGHAEARLIFAAID